MQYEQFFLFICIIKHPSIDLISLRFCFENSRQIDFNQYWIICLHERLYVRKQGLTPFYRDIFPLLLSLEKSLKGRCIWKTINQADCTTVVMTGIDFIMLVNY